MRVLEDGGGGVLPLQTASGLMMDTPEAKLQDQRQRNPNRTCNQLPVSERPWESFWEPRTQHPSPKSFLQGTGHISGCDTSSRKPPSRVLWNLSCYLRAWTQSSPRSQKPQPGYDRSHPIFHHPLLSSSRVRHPVLGTTQHP